MHFTVGIGVCRYLCHSALPGFVSKHGSLFCFHVSRSFFVVFSKDPADNNQFAPFVTSSLLLAR